MSLFIISGYPWPSDTVKSPVSLNQERDTQRRKTTFYFYFYFIYFIVFEKSPMKSVAGRPHYCFLKFSFSPRVRAVHRSQFQATSALWSKTSNLHYSLMRLPPSPPPPSPAKHTQLSYAGLHHSRGGCWARPGRPSVTDSSSVTNGRNEFILVGTRDLRTLWGANATCQPLPFLSYREKGERRPSSGT
jgi:hypothetical protein